MMPAVITVREGRDDDQRGQGELEPRGHAAKKSPWVHETPACSPIAPKWIAADPTMSPATVHRSTAPIVVGRGPRGARSGAGRPDRPSC